MKIVIVGTAYPYRGGLAAYNERLARQFMSEGHDVSIVTFRLQYPGFLFPGKTQYSDAQPPADLKIKRMMNSVNPLSWIKCGAELRKQKPDFVIIKYWLPFMSPCFGTIARITRKAGTRVISIFDNVIPHEKKPGDRLLTRYFTSSIDGAVVMSASVMDDLSEFRKDIPVKLNPHPLFDNFGAAVTREEALAKLRLDPAFTYILFFGFIRAYKGLDLLFSAFADDRLRDKKLKLVVAGEFYEDDKPYRDQLNELGIDNDVVFFDRFISDDEVRYFFSLADLVVQPYRSATQSGVTQIAYHFEKPMLVTDVGGLSEIVPHGRCGYVVKADPGVIADSISDYFSNSRKETFTEGVRQEKKKFTWDRLTLAITEIYNMITHNP